MGNDLLAEIEAFLSETGMSEQTFGRKAANNGRLVERLRQVRTEKRKRPVRVWPETEINIRAFMKSARPSRSPHPKEAAR
jgi:hypothetical protein